MFAIGCLFLVVFPLVGMMIGGTMAGLGGAAWGAGVGFVLALVVCGVPFWALVKASRGRR